MQTNMAGVENFDLHVQCLISAVCDGCDLAWLAIQGRSEPLSIAPCSFERTNEKPETQGKFDETHRIAGRVWNAGRKERREECRHTW